MAIAVLINGRLRGLRAGAELLLIPPMIAPAVAGLNFRWLFNEAVRAGRCDAARPSVCR